jgi:hypothetical protein
MRADSRGGEEAEGAVPDENKKRAAHRALVDRILNGEGMASAEQRAPAFSNDGLSPPLHALSGKVATRPTQVTEADFAAAKALGFSEDQLFELVICAAVGQSARLYHAGLAALAEATVYGRPDNATSARSRPSAIGDTNNRRSARRELMKRHEGSHPGVTEIACHSPILCRRGKSRP